VGGDKRERGWRISQVWGEQEIDREERGWAKKKY